MIKLINININLNCLKNQKNRKKDKGKRKAYKIFPNSCTYLKKYKN